MGSGQHFILSLAAAVSGFDMYPDKLFEDCDNHM